MDILFTLGLVGFCISEFLHTFMCQGQCKAGTAIDIRESKWEIYSITPSTWGGGKEGMRFPKMAALPIYVGDWNHNYSENLQ